MSIPRIRVRDVNENRVGAIDEYMSATMVPKWNGVGTWQIVIPANAQNANLLVPGCGISCTLPDGSDFSGHATDFLDEWDAEGNGGDGTITVSGVEDKAILGYRVVLPDPTAAYTSQTAVATYARTGAIETLIKNVVSDNLGQTSLAARRLTNLTVMPSNGAGASTTVSGRYDNLLDFVQRLASPNNFGFTLSSVPGGWIFDTKRSIDVSSYVKFSRELGNMTKYSFGRTAPKMTRDLVAGQGLGTARNVMVFDQAAGAIDPVWGFMIEGFTDRRDTNLTTDLAQAGAESLSTNGEQVALSATVIDTDEVRIGRDYGLGSIVKMSVRGVDYTDVVSQIQYTFKPDETRIVPTIGSGDAVYGRTLDVYRVVRSISARIALLERRQ